MTNDRRPSFKSYIPHFGWGKSVEERLRRGLARHYDRTGRLPSEVVVNPREVEQAKRGLRNLVIEALEIDDGAGFQEALRALALKTALEVKAETSGGKTLREWVLRRLREGDPALRDALDRRLPAVATVGGCLCWEVWTGPAPSESDGNSK